MCAFQGPKAGEVLMFHSRIIIFLFAFWVPVPAYSQSPESALERLWQAGLAYEETVFLEKVKKGDEGSVTLYLAAGMNPDAKDSMGRTALMIAADRGDTSTAKVLLARGADVSGKSIHGTTALMTAAEKGHTGMVRLLLSRGAGANTKDGDGRTALMFAARGGHPESVKALLSGGADPNAKAHEDWTPLMFAADGGHTATVELLLARGAEVDTREAGGRTALMLAAGGGHADAVRVLLSRRAQANVPAAGGWTPLMLAAAGGYTDTVQVLLDHGADANVRDEHGLTPLMLASSWGHADTVDALLSGGADVNIRDQRGKTALTWAIGIGYVEVVRLLKRTAAPSIAFGLTSGVNAADAPDEAGLFQEKVGYLIQTLHRLDRQRQSRLQEQWTLSVRRLGGLHDGRDARLQVELGHAIARTAQRVQREQVDLEKTVVEAREKFQRFHRERPARHQEQLGAAVLWAARRVPEGGDAFLSALRKRADYFQMTDERIARRLEARFQNLSVRQADFPDTIPLLYAEAVQSARRSVRMLEASQITAANRTLQELREQLDWRRPSQDYVWQAAALQKDLVVPYQNKETKGEGYGFLALLGLMAAMGWTADMFGRRDRIGSSDYSLGRILVVDDEPDIRKVVKLVLSKSGYDVIEAEDGEKAIEVLNSGDNPMWVSVIICDIRMPNVSGLEAIRYFRDQYPSRPVIVLTGFPDPNMATSLLKQGVVEYLVKPIGRDKLAAAVTNAMKQLVAFIMAAGLGLTAWSQVQAQEGGPTLLQSADLKWTEGPPSMPPAHKKPADDPKRK